MMNENQGLLDRYGITLEQKTFYLYKKHRYDSLKDAVNYAKLDEQRAKPSAK